MDFQVTHDFSAFRPTRWHKTDYERTFGERNEGFRVSAPTLADAREIVRKDHHLNPGLLQFVEI